MRRNGSMLVDIYVVRVTCVVAHVISDDLPLNVSWLYCVRE